MKIVLALVVCILTSLYATAQSLSLFDIDTTNFPTMKAKFYAFDAAGNQVRPSVGELTLTENSTSHMITSVSCPPPKLPIAISSVLTMDVSSSMSSGAAGASNIELAKAAARAWIQGLPTGQSECALSSFDDKNYLNQDFTTDRSRLLNSLSTLSPNGGTDYDMGLLKPLAGSLQVSQRGKYKRVIIFLSDGMPILEPSTATIIAEAKRQNCIIFAVTLGMLCPQSLKEITSQTGGEWYENVTTTPDAERVYRKIIQLAQGNDPCEISWQSGVTCEAGKSKAVELRWQTQKAQASYLPPPGVVASLKVAPSFVRFGKHLPATSNDTTIMLTTQNADFIVTKITSKIGSADFSVVNTTFPLFIPKNTTKTITLRFLPSDSGKKYASFEIETDKCSGYFSVNGGFPGKKITVSSLKLTKPNGGETFVVGSDTVIMWEGVAPSDTVSLEYSADNGATWQLIEKQATGLNYIWKNVPRPTSIQCLVRVKQEAGNINSNAILTLTGHTAKVNAIAYSPDGNHVATASWDKTMKIWDANNGMLLRTLTGHTASVNGITYSLDGSRIATASDDGTAKIWDANADSLLRTLTPTNSGVDGVAYSPDGNYIAVVSDGSIVQIYDVNTGVLVRTLTWNSSLYSSVSCLVYSPDGSRIAGGGSDRITKIWDANNGKQLRRLMANGGVLGIAYSPDGSRVATSGMDKVTNIWDANTEALLQTLRGHSDFVLGVAYSPDGSYIATAGRDSTVKIWNANTGMLLRTLMGHSYAVQSVAYSPDGSCVATASEDHTAKIWDVDFAPIQEDISDSVFSIVAPLPASQDVDMRQCLVGAGRDSLVYTFVQNTGSYLFRVDSIQIIGAGASQFSLVSGIPPFDIPVGTAKSVEFRFRPTSVGVKTAQLLVFTQSDTLRQTIRGEGIAPSLVVVNSVVDFGKVLVGTNRDTLQAVTIRNIGSASLSITDTKHAGPNDKDFTTLAGGGNFVLPIGETARLNLRFAPSAIGRTIGRLLFDYNGVGSPAEVMLFAEGFRPDSGQVALIAGTTSAFPGEHTTIPITLVLPENSTLSTVTGFDVTLRYNSTLLFPADNSMAVTSSGNDALLTFFAPYNPAGGKLLAVPFITTLGNDTTTAVKIEKAVPRISSGNVDIVTRDGSFALNGVCYAGGAARLYKPSGKAMLMAIHPNPAEDEAEIEYETSETGVTSLKIVNALGMEVAVPAFADKEAGFHVAKVRTSDFGAGTYFVVMTTPTERHVTRFEVVR